MKKKRKIKRFIQRMPIAQQDSGHKGNRVMYSRFTRIGQHASHAQGTGCRTGAHVHCGGGPSRGKKGEKKPLPFITFVSLFLILRRLFYQYMQLQFRHLLIVVVVVVVVGDDGFRTLLWSALSCIAFFVIVFVAVCDNTATFR